MTPADGNQVKSLHRAMQVVEVLEERERAGVTELAEHLGFAKSTVHDHLQTLEATGFVVKEGRAYRLGFRFLDVGGRLRDDLSLYRIARPELRELADDTGELVNLVIEERGLGVYVDLKRGENAVNLDTYLGKREHLHSTAVGKSILAHRSPEFVDEVVAEHGLPADTERTVATRAELRERLERVRERGFAVDQEERLKGLCCVAAPINDESERSIGAVSVSGPTSRMHAERLEDELAEKVMRTTNIVEVNLAYS